MTTQTQQNTSIKQKPTNKENQDVKSIVAVTIGRKPEDVFAFFRRLENLPLFMKDLKNITVKSSTESHWVMEVMGKKVEWDARIVSEQPGQHIAWESEKNSSVETSGSIWFTQGPRESTEVRLLLDYSIPGGKATELVTAIVGESPQMLAITNLRRLKALMETGVVPTVDGQPSGREKEAQELKSQPVQKH